MSKTRVYQLAKEIGISSKELITKLEEFDLEVSNHMSSINDDDAKLVLEFFTSDNKDVKNINATDEVAAIKDDVVNDIPTEGNNKKQATDVASKPQGKSGEKKSKKNKSKKKSRKKKSRRRDEEIDLTEINNEYSNEIKVDDKIIVSEFADKLNTTGNDLIMKLMGMGQMVALNQEIDFETAELLADEYGYVLVKEEVVEEVDTDLDNYDYEDKAEDLVPRAPIVTVMGHVDHGKTSLLDAIRETRVTAGEAGGITQHIGASEVVINDQRIVFLDTPGHEAFTSLRARGAQITDAVILVVAADDGVMPQTIEAINHVKAAGVPMIIAVNKIDKPNANPDRVKQELTEHGILVEDWGGDVVCVHVSALQKQGIDQLLEMVLLVSEMQELKANPDRMAVGTIIESEVDKGRGPVATIIIEKGTLKVGDSVVAGSTYGRVRAMINDIGKRLKSSGPATAVEITGLNDVPNSGDKFIVVEDDKTARLIAEKRQRQKREIAMKSNQMVTLEDLFAQIQEGKIKDLNIIIKADAQGSIEALKGSLLKLTNDEVRVNVIHGGIGTIAESDILLASASNAIIIGFNVRPSTSVTRQAEIEGVELKTYRIIYEAIADVEAAMTGMLDPEFQEKLLGKIEVRATFKVPNIGTIAGAYVIEGKVTRNSSVRVVRDGILIFDGKISSLKRFKDDAKEVLTGFECGIGLENFNNIKEGDIIESYIIEEIKRG